MKRIMFGPWISYSVPFDGRMEWTRKIVGEPRLYLPDIDSEPVKLHSGYIVLPKDSNAYTYCDFISSKDLEWLKKWADEDLLNNGYYVYGPNTEEHKCILLSQEDYDKYMVLV